MEIVVILILVIALVFIKVKNYKNKQLNEEKLKIEVRECLSKYLSDIDTGEPYNYFSKAVVEWFRDFKENNKNYILGESTMYNGSSDEAKSDTQIWVYGNENSRYFYSPDGNKAKKRNRELTFADVVLLQKCKEFLEKRDKLFNKIINI